MPEPPARSLTDPVTGEPGVRLEFRAADGRLLGAEHRNTTVFAWWGDGLPAGIGWGEDGTISLLASYRPETSGPYTVGAAGVGRLTLTVDGTVAATGDTPVPADPVETMTRPGEVTGAVKLTAGQPAQVRLDFLPSARAEGPLAVRLGIVAAPDEEAALDQAVEAAAAAAVAVVVVGSAETTESEGFDRDTLRLPGRQDELVERVCAVNPRTVVVVNAGMPVLMPWASRVAAVLYAWLPGQAMGDALADVLLGRAEPGGRLPVTMPAHEADAPVLHAVPVHSHLDYDEGLLIGYRGYDAAGTSPLFAFGHGLGYTSWAYESLTADQAGLPAGADLSIEVTVRNTGPRTGREVVQAYVAGPAVGPGRPVRVLGAFGTVTAAPGTSAAVTADPAGPGVRPLRRAGRALGLAARPVHHRGRPLVPRPAPDHRGDRGLTRTAGLGGDASPRQASRQVRQPDRAGSAPWSTREQPVTRTAARRAGSRCRSWPGAAPPASGAASGWADGATSSTS